MRDGLTFARPRRRPEEFLIIRRCIVVCFGSNPPFGQSSDLRRKNMTSKFVLITGAYRGLGLECARQLLVKGYEVILTARRAREGAAAAQELSKNGKVSFVAMDV